MNFTKAKVFKFLFIETNIILIPKFSYDEWGSEKALHNFRMAPFRVEALLE